MLFLHGDSLAANKLVISQIAEDTPDTIPVVDAPCLGHQVSLSCDDMLAAVKSELDVANPMYATKQLMQQMGARRDVYKVFGKLADEALIVRGVWPPPAFAEHNSDVLKATLGDGVKETLYTLRGNFASPEFGAKEAAFVDDLMRMFNGDWTSERWQHYCCRSADDRRPCCSTVVQARKKAQRLHGGRHTACRVGQIIRER